MRGRQAIDNRICVEQKVESLIFIWNLYPRNKLYNPACFHGLKRMAST